MLQNPEIFFIDISASVDLYIYFRYIKIGYKQKDFLINKLHYI